jgi:glutamyl-tRNA reductase
MVEQIISFRKKFYVAGISFKKTDSEHRSKFSISPEQGLKAYQHRSNCLEHYFILSTCNRTEIYGFAPCEYVLMSFMQHLSGAPKEELSANIYSKEGDEAVKHLLTVAAGLDSQIPGDYEIIGQIRKAFHLSKKSGRSNGFIERVVSQASQVSKAIKNNTGFSDGTVSVSYSVARQISGIVTHEGLRKICIVGLGKTGHNTLKYLKQHAPTVEISLVNRDEKKLRSLADQYGVKVFPYASLSDVVKESDIVIVATGAAQPILNLTHVRATPVRHVFDLSMPRNVAEDVYQCGEVSVFDVDQISAAVNQTLDKRLAEVPAVKAIVQSKAREFFEWQERRRKYTTLPAVSHEPLFNKRNHVNAPVENSLPRQHSCFMADQCCEGKTGVSWLPIAARPA